jgi:hypothetical protein
MNPRRRSGRVKEYLAEHGGGLLGLKKISAGKVVYR